MTIKVAGRALAVDTGEQVRLGAGVPGWLAPGCRARARPGRVLRRRGLRGWRDAAGCAARRVCHGDDGAFAGGSGGGFGG
jgi:hypothetical protein